jgi:hypothetical protein
MNSGTINTGNGNDTITCYGHYGIANMRSIDTGEGNDIVDALTGGFSGGGTILLGTTNLGNGNDVIKGFGSGYFDGGLGTDKLLFGSGTYTVSNSTNNGFYTINDGATDMLVQGFEFVGSASNSSVGFSFSSVIGGTFTV